jgi:hypothetical protein
MKLRNGNPAATALATRISGLLGASNILYIPSPST